MNEWKFSLYLLIISSIIVLAKCIFIYGNDVLFTFEDSRFVSTNWKYGPHNYIINQCREKRVNLHKMSIYTTVLLETIPKIVDTYAFVLKGVFNAAGILVFTWFIIYKDSSNPGVDSPLPINLTRMKSLFNSRVNMSYSIGIINALLIFIYIIQQ